MSIKKFSVRTIFILVLLNAITLSLQAIEEKSSMDAALGQKEIATFAGGCFWCMQPPFDQTKGVLSTRVGYMGGTKKNPSYEEVSTGQTGHTEVIEITFDPLQISYDELLKIFWINIDPTTLNQQFADIGTQYRTTIFYHSDRQMSLAIKSKEALAASDEYRDPIVTTVERASDFYPAENYHQDYYIKNPLRYNAYKYGSGRGKYVDKKMKNKKRSYDS